MQYSGKVQQKALTLIQGTLVQSDPAAPGIGANASAGEIATWIEDDGGLKGALRILPAALATSSSGLKRAKARMRLQLRLDWKLATDGSSKRAETTMRPHGRAAFLKRWGALCWRGVGGRWEYDALVDPDAQ